MKDQNQLRERSQEIPRQQYTKAVNAEEAAQALGLVAFQRTPRVLMLDMDMPKAEAIALIKERWAEIYPGEDVLDVSDEPELGFLVTRSKSGNTHVYLRCARSKTDTAAIALQLFLGSDPAREALSLHTVNGWRWQSAPTILFETPEEAKRVQAWLEGA